MNDSEAPKCYIDLMKRCLDSNPDHRPNAIEIHKLIESFYNSYTSYIKGKSFTIEIKKQFKEAEDYRKKHLSNYKKIKQHPQAIYTSRLFEPITPKYIESECIKCAII
ncbi:hypothetical protein C1645_792772, partial [Glomus cerebriforme]